MKLTVREIAVFSMLGAILFASKLVMEALPNIHILGVLIMAITLVYRAKALYPIYLYVMMNGLYAGFNPWWIPYLYIWTILWGATMLLPKKMPRAVAPVVYAAVCGLHGFAFGTLYTPAQVIMFGYNFEQTLLYMAQNIPFDLIHGVSNLVLASLIIPITKAIRAADRR